MRRKALPLFALLLPLLCGGGAADAQAQGRDDSAARLFVRYEVTTNGHRVGEDVLRLKNSVSPRDGVTVALRVCSRLPLPLAAANAVNPFDAAELLLGYGFSPGQVLFTRAEDCAAAREDAGVTEVWVVGAGGQPPPHVESLGADELEFVRLGKLTVNRGDGDYRVALRRLTEALRADSDSAGVVFGYYLKRPSATLNRRMREATAALKRSGAPPSRYLVRTKIWHDEVSAFRKEREPVSPTVFVVKVSRRDSAAARGRRGD